ncbi:hypothetical protein JGS22_017620 [Streptomyces sp. P38-E01]|uniref:Uncharacterized protein n=1 Tax=Streptomyces tardus TaxID=2780544 RepID=A0A949JIR0_9ACTN|nr:hypothetical protein [Streptomyces tardus]MBU7599385.1 hypothetical protein [Streptomyces tardus]
MRPWNLTATGARTATRTRVTSGAHVVCAAGDASHDAVPHDAVPQDAVPAAGLTRVPVKGVAEQQA